MERLEKRWQELQSENLIEEFVDYLEDKFGVLVNEKVEQLKGKMTEEFVEFSKNYQEERRVLTNFHPPRGVVVVNRERGGYYANFTLTVGKQNEFIVKREKRQDMIHLHKSNV